MAATRSRGGGGRARARGGDIWAELISGSAPIGKLYDCAPMERVALVREGMPAEMVTVIAAEMAISKDRLYRTIGVPRATLDRKVRARQRLNPDESERLLGMARLVGQAAQIVRESGDAEGFDAARWVAEWLDSPLPALGGERPATLMDTSEGRRIVSDLMAQMQSGAYA